MNESEMNENKVEIREENKDLKTSPNHVLRLIGVLFLGICIGLFMRLGTRHNNTISSSTTDLSRFEEVYKTISDSWVDANDDKDLNLESAAIAGFLNSIGDPHTTYFTNEALQEFTSAVEGSFAGIGVTYTMRDEGGFISAILPDTPASQAGLMVGDVIVAVDDASIQGLTSTEVKKLVVGPEGTNVKISVTRDGSQLDFSVTRKKIDSSVIYDIRDNNGKKLGYLDINTFGDMTDQSVARALQNFKDSGVRDIVIDLRDDTGGYLSSVQNILSLFLPKGTKLFGMQEKEGPAQYYASTNDINYTFDRGYILVNGETASAAEVMAGVLSELLDYQLVGSTTYGKGTAQRQVMLSDMSSFKYTYAKWLLPSGNCINGIGLEPDISVDAISLSDFYTITLEDGQTLAVDSVSIQCAQFQQMLMTLGYDTGRNDGYFSEQTKLALQQFETDQGLTVDGIYDSSDNTELISAVVRYFNDVNHDACYQRVLEELR